MNAIIEQKKELYITPLNGVIDSNTKISGLPIRDKIFAAEAAMKQMPQIELSVNHYFSKDVYARELFIPKGVTLVGKIHKFQNLNIMTKGRMLLSDGSCETIEVVAPFIIVSPAGTKRIAHALEDTIWITVHGTDKTDVETIENTFVAQSEQEYIEFCRQEPKLPFEEIKLL